MSEETLISTFTELRRNFLRLAMRFLPSVDDAEDVLQEAFCRLWPRAGGLHSRQEAEAMSVTTVKNLCIDEVRRRNKVEAVEFDAERDARITDSPQDRLEREELFYSLETIINSELTPLQQQVLRLHEYEEMSMEEIADRLGMQPAAVRMNLSRARRRIREVYQERRKTDEG